MNELKTMKYGSYEDILLEKNEKIKDLKISNDEWKRKCSKYKTTLNKIKEYINEYEVCLIKNGVPEISRNELVKIIEGVE